MRETNEDDAVAIGLAALGWIIGEANRAERFLALTGITPDDLRHRITEPSVLDAGLGFLEGHQPDLIACAENLGVSPDRLITARGALNR